MGFAIIAVENIIVDEERQRKYFPDPEKQEQISA